jgi:hypothetical protein
MFEYAVLSNFQYNTTGARAGLPDFFKRQQNIRNSINIYVPDRKNL